MITTDDNMTRYYRVINKKVQKIINVHFATGFNEGFVG